MTGFELQTSVAGSDRSTNCATTTAAHSLKTGQSRPLFVYFRSFLITISIIQIENSMVCLGFEPRAAEW